MLFAYLVFRYVRTRKEIQIVVLVLLASAVFQAFYGLIELFGGTEKIFGFQKTYHLGSATGTYINRDHFSGLLEMIFPLCLGFLLARAKFFSIKKGLTLREKIIWFSQEGLQRALVMGLFSVIIGLGIFFSRSRSGIFISLLTISLMAIILSASGGKDKRRSRMVRTVFLAIIFAVVLIGIKPIVGRFSWAALSKEERPVFYKNTISMIGDYPLVGTGFGTYVHSYPMYQRVYRYKLLEHAHNDYLELAAEGGLVAAGALIAAAFGLLGFIYVNWTRRKDHLVKGVVLGCMMGITALLIHSLTDFNLHIPANAVLFLTLYALALRTVGEGRDSLWGLSHKANSPWKSSLDTSTVLEDKPARRTIPTKMTGTVVMGALLLALVSCAATEYLGYHCVAMYKSTRAKETSLQDNFGEMEKDLKSAIRFYHNPEFYSHLGRLYLDKSLVANAAGNVEQRDHYLDLAVAGYSDLLKRNPIDSLAFYDLGRAYMLYHSPLRTYAERGRRYFRRAIELDPSDEFLNVNVIYIYLADWDLLRPEEREFLTSRLGDVSRNNANFIPRIRDVWKRNVGNTDKLKEILSTGGLKPQLQQ